MAKHKKKQSLGNFFQGFSKRHDEEISHIVIFFIVGVLFFGSYAFVATVTAMKSAGVIQAGLNDLRKITVSGPSEMVNVVPDVLPRRLDGMFVATADANKNPTCVMIENAAFGGVRPQAGLSEALVVYEVIVEGGITRLMGVFDGNNVDTIGPIRSARDTYLEFVSEMNCAYVHAGGSFTAMRALQEFTLRDIDGLIQPGYFWREASKAAPHNLFTSAEKLRQAVEDHSWNNQEPPSFESWNFVDQGSTDDVVSKSAERVYIGFGGSYDTEYTYNASERVYERKNGGVEHKDANTDKILTAKNIVIQHVGEGVSIEGKGRINWPVTGEGEVEVIHDGRVYKGVWKKESRLSRTLFYDEKGDELPFARGNTWVDIVPPQIGVEIE